MRPNPRHDAAGSETLACVDAASRGPCAAAAAKLLVPPMNHWLVWLGALDRGLAD